MNEVALSCTATWARRASGYISSAQRTPYSIDGAKVTAAIRVLAIHNHYRQPGGEDRVFAAETRLLEAYGDNVIRYTAHNDLVGRSHPLALAKNTVWNSDTYRDVRRIIRDERPDVMHAHNTFPLISPAAHAAASDCGVPVVQTLHNFRLLCANGLLAREGRICEECVRGRVPWPAVQHRCYRGSVTASAVTATMIQYHRVRGTWRRNVDVFVALTDFARLKFIEAGLPAAKIMVKPNFVDCPSEEPVSSNSTRDFALFVGRLSREKGIETMLAAWHDAPELLPLRVVGDGPLKTEVQRAAASNPRIQWLGFQSPAAVHVLLRRARALILPSECYEMFPLVLLEAYSTGTPVISSKLGALASIVEDGRTGLHFAAGDSAGLREKVTWASANPGAMSAMGEQAAAVFKKKYTAALNYGLLRGVYDHAASVRADRAAHAAR